MIDLIDNIRDWLTDIHNEYGLTQSEINKLETILNELEEFNGNILKVR